MVLFLSICFLVCYSTIISHFWGQTYIYIKKTKHEQFFGACLSHCVTNYLNKRAFLRMMIKKKIFYRCHF